MNHFRASLDSGKENTEHGKIGEWVEASLGWGEHLACVQVKPRCAL